MRFFMRLCKRAVEAWCRYRGRTWSTCYDKACFRKPTHYVQYNSQIHWVRNGVSPEFGVKLATQAEMTQIMGYDKVGTSGCFCTKHLELLKKDPEREILEIRPYPKAA